LQKVRLRVVEKRRTRNKNVPRSDTKMDVQKKYTRYAQTDHKSVTSSCLTRVNLTRTRGRRDKGIINRNVTERAGKKKTKGELSTRNIDGAVEKSSASQWNSNPATAKVFLLRRSPLEREREDPAVKAVRARREEETTPANKNWDSNGKGGYCGRMERTRRFLINYYDRGDGGL